MKKAAAPHYSESNKNKSILFNCMLSDVKDIKVIRKRLGLTQEELARRAGISQSMIAKIESGNLEPSYGNAMSIFKALDEQSLKEELRADRIMSEKTISISPKEKVHEAIKKMKAHGFSQLPVVLHDRVLGMITESAILESLLKKQAVTVEDIMESPPPIIPADTTSSAVISLLKYCPMVLVSKKGRIAGIITKTDVLAKIHN
jgi:predicted transcriptional regulator